MTRYNTGNPLGSTDPRDLYDNAENLDAGINGPAETWVDRLGQTRKSWDGIETDFQQFLADGSTIEFPSWAVANDAASGGQIPNNRQAAVVGDNGSHTDPVTGQTVQNSGRYVMTPSGLQWVAADVLSQKASKSEVAAVAGQAFPTIPGDFLEVDNDQSGNVAFAVHADGTREFIKTKVGGLEITRVGAINSKLDGRYSREGVYEEWAAEITGDLSSALLVEIDQAGRVGRILWADGTQWPGSGLPDPTNFVLREQISIPNGAQGQNPNGGFTCTGLDFISTGKWVGCWVAGNDGRSYEGSSGGVTAPFLCSIVILSPDMRSIIKEIPCNTPDFPGIQSIQGVAWDSSDNTIWFVDKTNKTLRHITFDGVKLNDEIVVTHTANGVAYRQDLDVLYSPNEGGNQVYVISCATGQITSTLTGISSSADQLYYQPSKNRLWASVGNNGENGSALIYDAETMELKESHVLKGSQSIEGIYYDEDSRTLTSLNDGAFHRASANPPLALACKYTFE